MSKKKVYATIWYHPSGKWKLDEAIVVENGKIVNSCVGGSFFFGPKKVKKDVLKEALLDLLFYDPELEEEEWKKKFEEVKKWVKVEFVDDQTMRRLKREYPELEEEETDLSYIG